MTTVTTDTIAESFNKADGVLGPDLAWGPRRGPAGIYNMQVVANQMEFFSNTLGFHEDNRIPLPNAKYPDVTMTCSVTEMSRTGTGDYLVGFGLGARMRQIENGSPFGAYDGYTCELYKTTFFGGELFVIALNKLKAYPGGTVVTLASDSEPAAGVTLPGTLTFTVSGDTLTGTFTHAGGGAAVTATTTDATFADGDLLVGGGNDIRDPAGSGRYRVDSFSVTQVVPTATVDVESAKLQARYPTGDKNVGALFQRYRDDQNVETWDAFVAHVAGASPSLHVADDEKAFWDAFVP